MLTMEATQSEGARRLTLAAQIGLLMGPFLSMMDSNIVNVALPEIEHSLHSSLATAQWVISGYLLALSAVLAASAYLAKRFGAVRIYLISLAGFTIGSALCAMAPNIQLLIVGRVLQGALGAPLIPLAMSMIFGGGENSREQGIPPVLGMLLFLAPAIGPTIGGVLIHFFGWPSVFLVNVPIGLFGFAAALRIPKVSSDKGNALVSFDAVGIVTLASGLTLAVYGTSNGSLHGWMSNASWPYWTSGGLSLFAYVFWSLRNPHPAVDIKLFRSARTVLAVALCGLTSVVMFSIIVIVPVFMENVQNLSPLAAGLTLFPQALVMGGGIALGNKLSRRSGVRLCAMTGMLLLTLGSVALLLINKNTPPWITAFLLVFRGLGIGLVIQPVLWMVLRGLNADEAVDATTLYNVSERLGGATGVALLSTFLQARETDHMNQAVKAFRLSRAGSGAGSHTGLSVSEAVRAQLIHAAVQGFHDTFWLLAAIAFVGFLGTLFLHSSGRPEAQSS